MNLLHLHKFWHVVTVYMYLREDIEQIERHVSKCVGCYSLVEMTVCCRKHVLSVLDGGEEMDHETSVVEICNDSQTEAESTPTANKEDDANKAGTSGTPEEKHKETTPKTSSSMALLERRPREIVEVARTSTREDETMASGARDTATTESNANDDSWVDDDEHMLHAIASGMQHHGDDDDTNEFMVRWFISVRSCKGILYRTWR